MPIFERVFHAILFELFAVILSVTAIILFTDHSASSSTLATIIISLIAMLWNFVFNVGFDRIFTGKREQRSIFIRLFHTLAFEGGLLLCTIPIVAYFMQVSWGEAFIIDLALTLLIMCYTLIFNWIYDHLRLKFIRH